MTKREGGREPHAGRGVGERDQEGKKPRARVSERMRCGRERVSGARASGTGKECSRARETEGACARYIGSARAQGATCTAAIPKIMARYAKKTASTVRI